MECVKLGNLIYINLFLPHKIQKCFNDPNCKTTLTATGKMSGIIIPYAKLHRCSSMRLGWDRDHGMMVRQKIIPLADLNACQTIWKRSDTKTISVNVRENISTCGSNRGMNYCTYYNNNTTQGVTFVTSLFNTPEIAIIWCCWISEQEKRTSCINSLKKILTFNCIW